MFDVGVGGIAELIETGQFEEGGNLEAKRASGNVPANAWETVSAFANTGGGLLVLGLDESDDGWSVRGVANPDQMIQDIENLMRDRTKISFNVAGNGDIWKESVGDKSLVVIRVRRVPRRHRPVYINGDPNKAFVRNGEGDAGCSEEEIDRMKRDASPSRADLRVLSYLTIDDFDFDAVSRYRELSGERRPSLANHRLDTKAYLQSIEAWRIDREEHIEGPTVAGILMFGNDLAIREIRANHVVDYRRVPTDQTPSRRYTDRVRWRSHLFGAWEEIFPRLVRGLPVPFRLRGPHRTDEPEGLETLREAFVNLLVHTDYEELSDAVILHRDDGYYFENPGDSWVDPQDLGVQGRSERRNPIIAQMFDNVGLADQAGSGFIRILDEWKGMGFRRPSIVSDSSKYQFRLELSLAGLLPADVRGWLSEIGGPWREEEEPALMFARHHGSVDNQTLRSASGQHLFDASQTLRSLRDREYLVLQGAGKNTSYVLGPMASGEFNVEGSGHLEPSSGHSSASSGHLPVNSGHLGPSSGHLTPSTDDQLEQIAEAIAQSGKSSTDEVEAIIIHLCQITPMSSDDLSRLLKRSLKTVRRYISALIADGRLEQLHERRNHPGQRYRTTIKEPETTIQGRLEL